jgi:hypothetical protein
LKPIQATSRSRRFAEKTVLPNKGMKLTRPANFGALQLIPGVRPTCGEISPWEPPRAWTRRAVQRVRTERLRRPEVRGLSPATAHQSAVARVSECRLVPRPTGAAQYVWGSSPRS